MEDEAMIINRDGMLEMFNSFSAHGLEMAITLYVKGVVVSGILISAEKYFNEFVNQIRHANGKGNFNDQFADIIEQAIEKAKNSLEDQKENGNNEFIHLEKARIVSGEKNLLINFWRGSISSIDGFSMGIIESN